MSNTAYDITERLLNALDKNYNVIDMGAISEVISDLENINITKELLETTRLGKHVNELRRRTEDPTLARRAKMLVKRWRDLVIPDRSGVKGQSSSGSSQAPPSQQHSGPGSVEGTPQHSPLASRGYSPAVTPRLSSPQVYPQTHTSSQKQGSLTPSSTGVKPSALAQQIQMHQRRQPLTSPGHRNVVPPQMAKNTTIPYSPGLKTLSSPLVSPVVGKNTSPGLIKNLSPGLHYRFSPSSGKNNISPGSSNKNFPSVASGTKHSPSVHSRNSSPAMNRNMSPSGVPSSHRNVSPGDRNVLPATTINNRSLNPAVKNLSPALRLPAEFAGKSSSSSKRLDHYDSDSQDVILVDDDDDVCKPVPANPLTINDRSNDASKYSSSSSKRPRSPVNGEQWRDGGVGGGVDSQHSHSREAKKARKEPRGRKPKKRRNHKSENRTVDHSLDPVPSPFLPAISSSSTSPALKNGISVPIPSPISSVPVLVDDIDSRSPKPETVVAVTKPRSSRKNGCKKNSLDTDEYSAFIKNKIPAPGKKIKTTQELLEEIQSRKLGTLAHSEEKSSKPKEDFLTTYDNKKKEMSSSVITDIIELNDSNSSLKQEDISSGSKRLDGGVTNEAIKKEKENEPIKFEPVEAILARLPPIDRSWMYSEEDSAVPTCTCTLIYTTPEVEVKMPSPLHQPKKSIFDDDDNLKDSGKVEPISSVIVPALPLYEEKLDPYCEAASAYTSTQSDVTDPQVLALHNCFIPDVNGTSCDKKLQFGSTKKPICKMDYWGSKPYYDCQSKLFYSVVPKYNYLDYSLDRCVKNLTKIHFDKYEPVEATLGTKEWLDEVEKKTLEEYAAANAEKTEEFNSPADSPFSEHNNEDESMSSVKNETTVMDSVNLDRDLAISNSVAFDDNSSSQLTNNNNDPTFHGQKTSTTAAANNDKKEYEMDCDDMDSIGSESCKPWTEKSNRQSADETMDQNSNNGSSQDQIVKNNISCSKKIININDSSFVGKCDKKMSLDLKQSNNCNNRKRQLNYGDSVLSLPLNLKALNAAVGYAIPQWSPNGESNDNLSCVFRTNYDQDENGTDDAFTYSSVADTARLRNFNDLKREGVVERLKRSGSIDHTSIVDDEDAISDSDVKPKFNIDLNNTNNNNNIGALTNPDLDICISDGCPEWLDKLSRDEGFREWHEPIVRTSYNEEPLTVLPYIVID